MTLSGIIFFQKNSIFFQQHHPDFTEGLFLHNFPTRTSHKCGCFAGRFNINKAIPRYTVSFRQQVQCPDFEPRVERRIDEHDIQRTGFARPEPVNRISLNEVDPVCFQPFQGCCDYPGGRNRLLDQNDFRGSP